MPDLFGRTDQVFGGGLSSDASWMWWDNLAGAGLGLLITQMGIQYAQPIRRIFELGPFVSGLSALPSQPVYYVAGRPEGGASLSRVVGPAGLLSGFYSTYGNPCNPYNNLVFRALLGCINNGTFIAGPVLGRSRFAAWIMRGAVITSVSLSATAQEMMVSESVQLMFVGLSLQVWNGAMWVDVSSVASSTNFAAGVQPTGGPLDTGTIARGAIASVASVGS